MLLELIERKQSQKRQGGIYEKIGLDIGITLYATRKTHSYYVTTKILSSTLHAVDSNETLDPAK